jgi:hypothetical protein
MRKTSESDIFRVKTAKRMQSEVTHEINGEYTANTLAEKLGRGVDGIRIKFAELRKAGDSDFAMEFDRHAVLSPRQIMKLAPVKKDGGKANDIKVGRSAQGVAKVAPALLERPVREWPLWCALALTVIASVFNMAQVTGALKSSSVSSWAWTLVFSAAPFLLIYSRIQGFWKWFSIIGAMSYTGFCNAMAIFGATTAMDKGYILIPTVFLEAVTNFANTGYMGTARAISVTMAAIIAGIEFTAFKNLAK